MENKGKIYNVQVYNRQLSKKEIINLTSVSVKKIYNFNIFGIELTLKLPLWHFTKLFMFIDKFKHKL